MPTSTRQRILDAAASLAGGDALTLPMGELAAAAGVSRATLYRHFPNRDALAEALGERGVELDTGEGSARQRALLAMGELVGRQGRLGVTMAEVAEEAGVAPVTLFRVFGDRAGLFRAFVDEGLQRGATRERLTRGHDPEADLTQLAEAALRFCFANPGLVAPAFFPNAEQSEFRASVRAGTQATRDVLRAYFERAQAEGRLTAEPPARLVATFFGLVLAELLAVRGLGVAPGPPQEHAQRVVSSFLSLFGGAP